MSQTPENAKQVLIDAIHAHLGGGGDGVELTATASGIAQLAVDAITGGDSSVTAAMAYLAGVRLADELYPQDTPDKNSESHLKTLDNMERTGGGFVASLAAAWRRADLTNHLQLYRAFSNYYKEYRVD